MLELLVFKSKGFSRLRISRNIPKIPSTPVNKVNKQSGTFGGGGGGGENSPGRVGDNSETKYLSVPKISPSLA